MSKITTRIYVHAVEEFAQYFKTPPDRLSLEHLRQYQAHLFADRKLEAVSVAQQVSALRFFFVKTLKRPLHPVDMPAPKQPIRLPVILSQEEVERLDSGKTLLTQNSIHYPGWTSRLREK